MLPDWPTPRVEAWKYTNLKGLVGLVLPEGTATLETSALPPGVTLSQTTTPLTGLPDNSVVARALAADSPCWHLHIAAGTILREPIRLMVKSGAVACTPKLHLFLGQGAAATIIETAEHGGLANGLAIIELEAGAHLTHLRLQQSHPIATHLDTRQVQLGKSATYNHFCLTTGGLLTRYEPHITLNGQGAEAQITAIQLLSRQQLADLSSVITHAVPQTTSREVVKTVLRDEAHAVFQGRIVVAPDAQKTNGHQLSRALLLSPRAEMSTKPELEIFADDVKCSHGAATGALDETALFYLKSRGVPEAEARALLVHAFVAEAIEALPEGALRTEVESEVAKWLS